MRRSLALCALLAGCSLFGFPVNQSDARFQACGGDAFEVVAAFPMVAADYQRHFPRMGFSPELDVNEEAFAVVFAEGYEPAVFGPGGQAQPQPGLHYVCVYVGTPPNGTQIVYGDIDITGMRP
jgi:hypothetical protein